MGAGKTLCRTIILPEPGQATHAQPCRHQKGAGNESQHTGGRHRHAVCQCLRLQEKATKAQYTFIVHQAQAPVGGRRCRKSGFALPSALLSFLCNHHASLVVAVTPHRKQGQGQGFL